MNKILITLITLVSFNLLHSQTFPSPGSFTLPAGKTIVVTYEVDVNANACPEGTSPVATDIIHFCTFRRSYTSQER